MKGSDEILLSVLTGTFLPSEAIEDQEARGQRTLISSKKLPKNARGDWPVLESWGVVKGSDADDLFCNATLPAGWTTAATDHSMWNNLLDNRGLIRATFFYKAAFYDRDAFMNVYSQRFCGENASYEYPRDEVAKAPTIKDLSLSRVVERMPVIRYAVHSKKGIGVLCDGIFHWDAIGDYSSAHFAQSVAESSEVTTISNDKFYAEFHHQGDGQFPLINASDNLAKAMINQALERYPSDDSQWSAEWDLPEQKLENI